MIHALVLFFSSIWPFHHAPAVVTPPVLLPGELEVHTDDACTHEGGKWFYLGEDNMVGVSSESCENAFQRWAHEQPTYIPRELI